MSKRPLRPAIEEALPAPDGGARTEMAQQIADYALGCDIAPVLSDRLTAQYMYDHMGGLEGAEEGDLERLRNVEAYNVVFAEDGAEFVVDRRSIFDPDQEKSGYDSRQDARLINKALQNWFKTNVFMKDRAAGSDSSVVDRLVESRINLRFGIGACLKYGLLHSCFEFPTSLHDHNQEKTMYIEMHADIQNVRGQSFSARDSAFPYFHLWEHEDLRFRMQAITYSDEKYLTVHMPGYG